LMAKIGKPDKVFGKSKTSSDKITVNVSPPKSGSLQALTKSNAYFIPGPMFGGNPVTQRSPFRESGYPGLRMYQGYVSEDFMQDLRGKRGIEVYEEMRKNDAVVGSMLRASYQLIHNAGVYVDPSAKNPDAQQSQLAADIVRTAIHDMKNTWADVLSEILTMLPFGWAYCAVWLKKRNGYKRDPYISSRENDAKYGWANISIRAHNSLDQWETDKKGRLSGMIQAGPPSWQPVRIPLDNAAHFRTDTYKENPEGESVLRNAWLAWKMKTELEEVEAIGLSRELTGQPVLTVPEGVDIWNTNDSNASSTLSAAKDIVTLSKADKYGGYVLPYGWELKVLTTPGQRAHNSDTVISRWDQRIAVTMLADMLLIGHERVGSYALVNQKSRLFSSALESYAARISGVFNKDLIPRLMSINGIPQEYWPTIRFGQVDTPDLKELAEMVNAVANTDIKIDEAFGLAVRQHMSVPPPRVGDNAVKTHEEKLEEKEVEFEQGLDHMERQQEMFNRLNPPQEGGDGQPGMQTGSPAKDPDEKEKPKNKPEPPPGKDSAKKVLVVQDSPMTRYALGLLDGDDND
jgi:hypothetical protein